MSKIIFEQVDENLIEVIIPPETPMEMVQQLTKSFISKGLVEDLGNSTLSVRYFYRSDDKVNTIANSLIKSLKELAKDDPSSLPHWHPKAQMAHQKHLRAQAITERRAKIGMGPAAPAVPSPISAAPKAGASPTGVGVIPHDSPSTAGGTGRRYAYINDPIKKIEEHLPQCKCGQCEDIEKSGYGVKGTSLYNVADNVKRKANNVGDSVDLGPNKNVKSYSSKPGQLSGKSQADLTARIQNAANKKQPVTTFTAEEWEAEKTKREGLKKGWADHLPFPSAEEEIMRLAKNQPIDGEAAAATQLMKLMAGKSMLGNQPPAQPTNEEMFGGGVVTEEMAKAADNKWGNTFNNWMVEAQKPISQRFASEEDELAYWANIKVADKDDGKSGY